MEMRNLANKLAGRELKLNKKLDLDEVFGIIDSVPKKNIRNPSLVVNIPWGFTGYKLKKSNFIKNFHEIIRDEFAKDKFFSNPLKGKYQKYSGGRDNKHYLDIYDFNEGELMRAYHFKFLELKK